MFQRLRRSRPSTSSSTRTGGRTSASARLARSSTSTSGTTASSTSSIDRWLPADEIIQLDTEHIGFGPLRGQAIRHEILPKSSLLLQRGEIAGEYTAEVKSETAHARATGLATVIV
jgi:hypothetical protein